MDQTPTHIVLTGGGTGGHLFPAIAVAQQLRARNPQARLTLCGCGVELEQRHVAEAGFDYLAIESRPLTRSPRGLIPFLAEQISGQRASARFLRDEQVDGVVATGGYASAAMARAAIRSDVPLVLVEQNVVPGRVTRWLASRAAAICTSYAETENALKAGGPVYLSGNPLRDGFAEIASRANVHHENANDGEKRLVVLGGSNGSESLNQNVPRALYKIRDVLAGWEIIHQTGHQQAEQTALLYKKLGIRASVSPFIINMPQVLGRADFAISRAGGTALAELAVAGVPAVVVPYPFAVDDHQRRNAEHYEAAGGVCLLDGRKLPGRLDDHLATALHPLVENESRRNSMRDAMLQSARPGAAPFVARVVEQLLKVRLQQAA